MNNTFQYILSCRPDIIRVNKKEGIALDIRTLFDEKTRGLWQQFVINEQLTPVQEEQFAKYFKLLIEWSEKINLTTITAPSSIIRYHFQDSLQLGHAVGLTGQETIVDVGSGGGFPGIPLAIKYPQMSIILIEVSHKKITFLDTVINALALENVEIYTYDWRTFLRKTEYDVDYICARASLHPDELIRMFKPASPYRDATLVYWASVQWEPEKKEASFMAEEFTYTVGNKRRKLVFFKNSKTA